MTQSDAMSGPTYDLIEIDGHAPTAAELTPLIMANYGHITAMQVRAGRVRGLDQHLRRLDQTSRELHGVGLDSSRVRRYIRHALDGVPSRAGAGSVRMVVFQPDRDAQHVCVVVGLGSPTSAPTRPWRVRSVVHGRAAPHLKHVGGFGSVYYGSSVKRAGYDEALFVDSEGVIAEGAITNIGFIDGGTVVWPDAPALPGICLQLVQQQLSTAGVPMVRRRVRLPDVAGFDGVFLTNSWGVIPVSRIDDTAIPTDRAVLRVIHDAHDSAPLQDI